MESKPRGCMKLIGLAATAVSLSLVTLWGSIAFAAPPPEAAPNGIRPGSPAVVLEQTELESDLKEKPWVYSGTGVEVESLHGGIATVTGTGTDGRSFRGTLSSNLLAALTEVPRKSLFIEFPGLSQPFTDKEPLDFQVFDFLLGGLNAAFQVTVSRDYLQRHADWLDRKPPDMPEGPELAPIYRAVVARGDMNDVETKAALSAHNPGLLSDLRVMVDRGDLRIGPFVEGMLRVTVGVNRLAGPSYSAFGVGKGASETGMRLEIIVSDAGRTLAATTIDTSFPSSFTIDDSPLFRSLQRVQGWAASLQGPKEPISVNPPSSADAQPSALP